MFLTKIILNIKNRRTLNALSNANEMHKVVMSMFKDIDSETPRKDMGVLYTMDIKGNEVSLLIQSNVIPNGQRLLNDEIINSFQTKCITNMFDSIKNDDIICLEVMSEPYKKVENSNSKNARRKNLIRYEDKLKWFERKIEGCGCYIIDNTLISNTDTIYGKKGNFDFTYRPSIYRCHVKVNDVTKFIRLLKNGLGSGKAYGMGMFKIYR